MRSNPSNILRAALLAAALGAGAAASVSLQASAGVSQPKHRRAGNGPGTKAHQRAARKARNVQRNRKAHRG